MSKNVGTRFAAVLLIIIVMIATIVKIVMFRYACEEMPVEEMPVADMPVCEVFEPPKSRKQVESMTPHEVVEQITWGVRAKLQCNQDYYADNPDHLHGLVNEILLPRFDPRYAAQLVLGRHWQSASAEQHERFIKAFSNLAMRRYLEFVLQSDLERLEVLPFDGDATKKHVTVKTIMGRKGGPIWKGGPSWGVNLFCKNVPTKNVPTRVPVNYGMVKRDKEWLVFDVTAEGISYVRNLKAEVNAEIQANGLDALIERLEADTSDGTAQ